MFEEKRDARRRLMPLAVSLCALTCTAPAFGQIASDEAPARRSDSKRPTVSQAKPTSPSATINLVNLLVKQGVLKEEQAQALIKQADDEAYVAREAAKGASTRADEAAKAANAATAAASPPGTRHVTYVPEIVKRQLREDIKREVMDRAHKENWASPGKYPEWAQRIRFSGDLRARYQGSFFPPGNNQIDAKNYNAINTGSPYDEASSLNFPTYNTTQDRHQPRLRVRLGMEADIYNGFSAGLRIATGENGSPVATNQTLGASGGNFSKYALWLDRGFLKYQAFGDNLNVSVGRFDNPFWSPTDLVWHRDLGFDGAAVQAKYDLFEGFTPFAVAGAFSIYNTDANAGSNLLFPEKFASQDRWLFGGQAGFVSRFAPESSFRFAAAYYDFANVQARLSSPCLAPTSSDICDTDMRRPSFAQKGNAYTALRDLWVDPANPAPPLYQYYGLVGQYRPVVASAQLDLGHFHPVHVILDGEYIWNSAFDRGLMNALAENNRGPDTAPGVRGPYAGGNQGWLARVTVGDKVIKRLWDWNVHAGYKYLESDATIDAFVDSDFGLGGTNLKGYFVGGNVGLSDSVWASLRWMSANNIAGLPYAVDVLQVDLNAKF